MAGATYATPPPRAAELTCLRAVVASLVIPLIALAQQSESVDHLKTDSRSPYVHRITLYDHDGKAIRPTDAPALPYSPRATCGKCHPYAEIRRGWHFTAGRPAPAGSLAGASGSDQGAGRPGEPWFVIDDENGSVVAISARGWPGTIKPADAGLSDWDMVKRFGRHMPGGGFGEPVASPSALPPGKGLREGGSSGPRWSVSGPLEIDCMVCHSANQQHDPAEMARQIEKENFRWAATAALGLGVVRGEARKAPDDWDPFAPPDPDFPERAGPTLIYDKTRFDADDRVLFDITRRVPNERCYFCHTTRIVGAGAPEAWHTDQDVHIAAGLLCVDCHRHGIDHAMTRGYEGESEQPARASRTCRGCHLGAENSHEVTTVLGGRLRAPHPQHAGLPPLHLEKLACTACHSGPWPQQQVWRMQTAMAHELGLPTRERRPDLPPRIVGPVFGRRSDEEPIAAHRRLDDGDPQRSYRWPLAHDVRPAAQSLGVRGCEDCHSVRGSVFFGAITSTGEGHMYELHGYDPTLARIWALGFEVRPAFRYFGGACVALMAITILRAACGAAPWVPPARMAAWRRLLLVMMLVGAAVQAVTGFGGEWLRAEVSGWTLLVHLFAAPLFIVGLTGVAMLCPASDAKPTGWRWRQAAVWSVILAGFVVVITMLAAMLPYFGYAAQETLTEVHGVAAYVLLGALVAWAASVWLRSRA